MSRSLRRLHRSISNFSKNIDEIADAKAEIFSGLVPGGVAILNRDLPQYERLLAYAKLSPAGHVASFGEHEKADARLISVNVGTDHSVVEAEICGQPLSYRLGVPGRHFAMNALAVLLAAKAFGVDLEVAAGTLAFSSPQPGRGERLLFARRRRSVYTHRRELQCQSGVHARGACISGSPSFAG